MKIEVAKSMFEVLKNTRDEIEEDVKNNRETENLLGKFTMLNLIIDYLRENRYLVIRDEETNELSLYSKRNKKFYC